MMEKVDLGVIHVYISMTPSSLVIAEYELSNIGAWMASMPRNSGQVLA